MRVDNKHLFINVRNCLIHATKRARGNGWKRRSCLCHSCGNQELQKNAHCPPNDLLWDEHLGVCCWLNVQEKKKLPIDIHKSFPFSPPIYITKGKKVTKNTFVSNRNSRVWISCLVPYDLHLTREALCHSLLSNKRWVTFLSIIALIGSVPLLLQTTELHEICRNVVYLHFPIFVNRVEIGKKCLRVTVALTGTQASTYGWVCHVIL